jgi:hypothetical protein
MSSELQGKNNEIMRSERKFKNHCNSQILMFRHRLTSVGFNVNTKCTLKPTVLKVIVT